MRQYEVEMKSEKRKYVNVAKTAKMSAKAEAILIILDINTACEH